jgi:hypothetical protein
MSPRAATDCRAWPATAIALYALGLLAVVAVFLALGDDDAKAGRLALVTVPVLLIATASLVVRRARA